MSKASEVSEQVEKSRWYDASWMSLTTREGYFPLGQFSVRLGPTFDAFTFYHDLAHALWAVEKGQSWRLDAYSFGLNYTTVVTIFGRDYYEPTTTQGLFHEVETIALQCHLTRLCQNLNDVEVSELMWDGISSMVYMTDFVLFISDLKRQGKVNSTVGKENEEIALKELNNKCMDIYNQLSDARVQDMWNKTCVAANEIKEQNHINQKQELEC